MARVLAADPPGIREPMRDLLAAGGKRLRPALVLLCGQLGRYDFERLAPAALAVELTHASTLVHDDVIDRSEVRRGQPTVFASGGSAQAILVGDHYFARAFAEAAKCGSQAVELLASAVSTICAGEYQALGHLYRYGRSASSYLEHVRAKTAALLAASCDMGAWAGGLDAGGRAAVHVYGERMGTAFQIADDVLDYVGLAGEVGKPVGHDLLEGNVTLPLILARQHPESRNALDQLLHDGQPPSAVEAAQALDIVRRSGACEMALEQARAMSREAAEALAGLGPSDASRSLVAIAEYAADRRQ